MAKINFGGVIEEVATREEFSLDKAREVLKNETIAVLGYGVQGPGQACNLRDNGFNVIVGQREGKTYQKAVEDGWVPGKTLFSLEEAAEKGTIVCLLLSDASRGRSINATAAGRLGTKPAGFGTKVIDELCEIRPHGGVHHREIGKAVSVKIANCRRRRIARVRSFVASRNGGGGQR